MKTKPKEASTIKIIAVTAEEFTSLHLFGESLPDACKAQINTIEYSFTGIIAVTYKDSYGNAVTVPGGVHKIDYESEWMRLHYAALCIRVPCRDKPLAVVFAQQ